MERKILIATTNIGKIVELKAMLDLDADWIDLSYYPEIEEIEEDGQTFIENACKKAIGYARATGQWTIVPRGCENITPYTLTTYVYGGIAGNHSMCPPRGLDTQLVRNGRV